MAKMARENKLRERRAEKQARKDARRSAAANPPLHGEAGELLRPDDISAQPSPATEPTASPPEE
jgi:hypothetical protein